MTATDKKALIPGPWINLDVPWHLTPGSMPLCVEGAKGKILELQKYNF